MTCDVYYYYHLLEIFVGLNRPIIALFVPKMANFRYYGDMCHANFKRVRTEIYICKSHNLFLKNIYFPKELSKERVKTEISLIDIF